MCVFQILAASHAAVHAFPCCFLNLSNDTEILGDSTYTELLLVSEVILPNAAKQDS